MNVKPAAGSGRFRGLFIEPFLLPNSVAPGKEKISPSRIPVIELQIIRKLQSLPRYSGTCKSLDIVILNEKYGNKC